MNVKLEAINYTRDRYLEEQARFSHIEEKCTKLTNLLTLLLVALGGVFSFKSSTLLNPANEYDWLVIGVAFVTALLLFSAWGHALLALRISDWPVAAKSRQNCVYIYTEEKDQAAQQIFDCYIDTIETMEVQLKEKVRTLELAYNELGLSAWAIALFFFLSVAGELFS